MGGLSLRYVLRRIGIYLLTIFASATLIFVLSRAIPGDPVETMWQQLQMNQGQIENIDEIIAHYKRSMVLMSQKLCNISSFFGIRLVLNLDSRLPITLHLLRE